MGIIPYLSVFIVIVVSALELLAGHNEGYLTCKNITR